MGRESKDQTVIHSSSIALLQERFRQLQRVKEMREEKEMLRFFPESDRCTSPPNINQKPFNLFFQSELLLPLAQESSPSSQIKTCLSLWPDHSTHDIVTDNVMMKKKSHCLDNKSWWLSNTTNPLFVVDDYENESDVDTSLHL